MDGQQVVQRGPEAKTGVPAAEARGRKAGAVSWCRQPAQHMAKIPFEQWSWPAKGAAGAMVAGAPSLVPTAAPPFGGRGARPILAPVPCRVRPRSNF